MGHSTRSNLPRIIVEENFGHWAARFEGGDEGWGGDTPGTAVERLWDAHLNSQAAQQETGRMPKDSGR